MAHAAGQVWKAGDYQRDADFVPALGQGVLDLLAPRAGEAVLDLGCGDGALTLRLAEAGAHVTGLEPDPDMAATARARGLTVMEQDAHDPFGDRVYDAIFSNAALHWMRDAPRVLTHAFAALRPGGRLVAEQGGFGNVAAVVVAINAALEAAGEAPAYPWDFPSPALQTARLEAAGFAVTHMTHFARQTPLPNGMGAWLRLFGGPFVQHLPARAQADVLADAERRLKPLHDEKAGWVADYYRLRFAALKPA
ncbi:MAG: methyltransferase domain-containing protein [Paracoccus sp. (in: a-proteobacteria)]|nr:methyltransferase domain-containing protein [Paracoccus sp. (in: a-proteobacteria)]